MTLLKSLASSALLLLALQTPANASLTLPAKPSVLLQADLPAWAPLFTQVQAALDAQERSGESLSAGEWRELRMHQALLAQARGDWALVRAPVERARRLQDQASGRHLAGLLNELLAEQQLRRADSAWLRRALSERVLAMPWEEVAPGLRTLRSQLAAMKAESVTSFVANRLDLSAGIASNKASLGFVMQLIGARVQLLQVLPQRDSLLQGLDDAFGQRGEPPPPTAQPPASQTK